MGDAPARPWVWIVVGVALASTMVPYAPAHYSFPRFSTVLVVWAAIVAHRGRPFLAAAPAFILTGWPLLVSGDPYPLCCTYGTWPLEPVVMPLATLAVALVLRPPERRDPSLADVLAVLLTSAVVTQAGLAAYDGRLDLDLIGWSMAALALGLGMGSGVRPWILAILPVAAFMGLVDVTESADAYLLLVVLVASTNGPIERRLSWTQTSANTTN